MTVNTQTRRIVPIHQNDSNEMKYIQIPSFIMNNEYDSIYENQYTAPSLNSIRSSKEPPLLNHEIRLLIDNPTMYNLNGTNSIYYLPSSCFSLLKDNTLEIVNLSDIKNIITDQSSIHSEQSTVTHYDSNTTLPVQTTITRSTDSILSSLYTLYFNNSYKDDYNNTFYNFIISPYTNLEILDENIYLKIYQI